MSIPERCTVLVIGGGPAGSYAASALAREDIDVVLLEADHFPRYHIGESMLPSFRNYLRFIDLDSTFDKYGFTKKRGAAFRLRPNHREAYTDFIEAGGENNYAWNVIRSESDELILRHAAKSGAKVFEGVKVDSVKFTVSDGQTNGTSGTNGESASQLANGHPGRPVFASYTRKEDGLKGTIKFNYIVDASGRMGLLSTKYLKNRSYNRMLKNVANWGYFEGTGIYGEGTRQETAPFFEALQDESGWAWFIPLHNGTTSVGVVRNQELATKAKAASASPKEYFENTLKFAPNLLSLIGEGKLVSELRSASDYSYSASSYSFPYARIIGDAGCFIDPFFSSGVHLALMGGLSAATTIAAAIKGDCSEHAAGQWHSNKIQEGYSRFLLAVLSTYKQMVHQQEYVLNDFGEDNFDKAFELFKPIIQGTADASSKITQAEFAKTIDFFNHAFPFHGSANETVRPAELTSPEEQEAVNKIRKYYNQGSANVDNFTTDVIDGRIPRLQRGSLGLAAVKA